MATAQSNQLWEQTPLNRAGLRRLKLIDAETVNVLAFLPLPLVPRASPLVSYEFVFPDKISAGLSLQRQRTGSGTAFWKQSIKFSLPHFSDVVASWLDAHPDTRWIAIAEDNNLITRLLTGPGNRGLALALEGTTGTGQGDRNAMSFLLEGDSVAAARILPSYADDQLFPAGAGFSYGFSLGFHS
jgi:hypothetical protein